MLIQNCLMCNYSNLYMVSLHLDRVSNKSVFIKCVSFIVINSYRTINKDKCVICVMHNKCVVKYR